MDLTNALAVHFVSFGDHQVFLNLFVLTFA